MTGKIFTVNSRKFDGTLHRSWQCELLEENEEFLILVGKFEKEINHTHLGIIRPGTLSYEFYWKKRWYNVFRFYEPGGNLRNFYCNINQPPAFSHNILDYVDLDIDVLVWKDFSHQILDLDEYEENAAKYKYPAEMKNKIQHSLHELIGLINDRNFPFDFQI
jgi:protein associated with RNAse G/E